MCGLFGLVYHGQERTKDQVKMAAELFTWLAVGSADRGIDATGLARVDSDGYVATYKNCLPSYEVVNFKRWWRPLLNITPSTVAVLGHTRFGTHGENTLDNTHPFLFSTLEGKFVGTHNGVISNHMEYGPSTPFANDSANLFHGLATGGPDKWGALLKNVRGSFAVVFANGPNVHIARNIGSPCYRVYVPYLGATVYASTYAILLKALTESKLAYEGKLTAVEAGSLYTYTPFCATPAIEVFETATVPASPWPVSHWARQPETLSRADIETAWALQADSVIQCDRCGKEDFWKFATSLPHGAILCIDCAAVQADSEDMDEVACESCGILTPLSQMVEDTAGGEFICKDCMAETDEIAYPCCRCGEVFDESAVDTDIVWLDAEQGFVCFSCFTADTETVFTSR